MGNFSLPADPLLFGRIGQPNTQSQFDYPAMRKMMEQKYSEYRPYPTDYVADLDRTLSELNDDEVEALSSNTEYQTLSRNLSAMIQSEMFSLVRARINANPDAARNIERQAEIIADVKSSVKNADRESMREMKDYMQNYSSMSFDEYRNMKSKKQQL